MSLASHQLPISCSIASDQAWSWRQLQPCCGSWRCLLQSSLFAQRAACPQSHSWGWACPAAVLGAPHSPWRCTQFSGAPLLS